MTQEVSNWGRWGPDDQLGMLNILSAESVLKAVRLVKKGVVYNLAVPLEKDGPQVPWFQKTWLVTYFSDGLHADGSGVTDDVLTMMSHSGTHIDALGHYVRDGKMWNGGGASEVSGTGLGWGAIHNVSAIVGRGVMLDIAAYKGVEHLGLGEVITVEDMESCAAAQGTEVLPGDTLLLHTGWYKVFKQDRSLWEQGEPGPDHSCGPWLKEKDVVAIGADNVGVESNPRGELPLHVVMLRDLGVYLLENINLDELARDKVYEFLFVGAPLRLTGATGASMTPLALA